ncbi:MAG: FkbM family methyltransferase [Mesorhizobium sp.]|uniref:FkbM family methyltransferase n=1 Tax=Mesorhizobium sp. TaxID=1871066 RepID=UPI0011F51DFE|nr:FkbM family methyltransferase [Mesorhizobium sp.]TIL94110.1 MAG: FkbM family methyltransferase [Mesorhizobium sp.]TIM02274.1 MAG: FkbM family methyltransferase [Mesorhizobium sp.]
MLKRVFGMAASLYVNKVGPHPGKRGVVRGLMRVSGETPVQSRFGVRLLSDWRDNTNLLSVLGAYHEVFAVIDNIRPGTNFIDVGANAGVFSCVAGRRIGTSGSVIAFEPSSDNFRRLLMNANLNKLPNFFPFQAAISSTTGVASFSPGPAGHSGIGHLEASGPVKVLTFGADALEVLLPPILVGNSTMIKIDVEGAEFDVVRALSNTLLHKSSNTTTVIIEIDQVNLARFGATPRDLYDCMHSNGFTATGEIGRLSHYDEVFLRH